MSYFEKYQKYKNKYNKLKLLRGGIREFTLYDVIYNDELKDMRKGFALIFKEKLPEIIRDLTLLLDNCGKDNLVRNISLYSININIDSLTKKISFSLNENVKCENSEVMRKYMEDEIMPRINKYNNLIKYIRKCQETTGFINPLFKVSNLLFFMAKDKKDANAEKELEKLINENTNVVDIINLLVKHILNLKKHSSVILKRTDFRFLSPEAMKFLYDLEGNINYDDIDFIKYRNSLIKHYESNYKELDKDYPITLQEQMNKYNEVSQTGPTHLTLEFNNLLEHLYSPKKDIGKLKDYMYKIEVYVFGLILMEIVKFIESNINPIESKYKNLIAELTHYDFTMRPDMYRLKEKIKSL